VLAASRRQNTGGGQDRSDNRPGQKNRHDFQRRAGPAAGQASACPSVRVLALGRVVSSILAWCRLPDPPIHSEEYLDQASSVIDNF